MPAGLPGGGMLKLRFDWYILNNQGHVFRCSCPYGQSPKAPDPALRYSKVLQNSVFYLLLQSVICHRVSMGSLPIVLFLWKCRHLECCLKTIPTMPCLPKIITQNPLRALHASEFNMATLGDEDKSSSASSESRSSSWYLVQVGR